MKRGQNFLSFAHLTFTTEKEYNIGIKLGEGVI